jgi:hypothetical protein
MYNKIMTDKIPEYLPINLEKFNCLLKEKNIKSINYTDLLDVVDNRFCTYKFQKGKQNGFFCLRKHKRLTENHSKSNKEKEYIIKDESKSRKKAVLFKCSGINFWGDKCKRNVKKDGYFCKYHNSNSEMLKNKNDNILPLKNNTDVTHPTRRKKERKKISVLDQYRNMEILPYLYNNKFNVIDNYSRKEIRTSRYNFNINVKSNLFIDNNNPSIHGRGLLNLVMYLYNCNLKIAIKHIKKYIFSFYFPSGQNDNFDNSEMLKINNDNILPLRKKKDLTIIYRNIPLEVSSNISYIIKYLVDVRCIDIVTINS